VAETLKYDSEDSERHINGWIFAFSFEQLTPLNKENTMDLGRPLPVQHFVTGSYRLVGISAISSHISEAVLEIRIRKDHKQF
jgi:hypothetical protein